MDANSMDKEEENQSPSILKLKSIELENKLLLEKQRYIILQSELESSKLIASKHLDIYKNECMSLKGKMSTLENDCNVLKEKELKNQEKVKNLLNKTERVDKENETLKNCKNLKKNDNEVKKEKDAHDNVMEKEGKNTRVFVDLDSDSDEGMKHSPALDSDDSLIVIKSECKTPSKRFKSSSESILCDNGLGNCYTQSPGNINIESARRIKYMGRIPSSKQKDINRTLERAEQLQKNIRNPSCVRSLALPLESELESSKLIASKRLDIYKNECNQEIKKLKNQEMVKNLLKKTEKFDKEYGSETQKNCDKLKKNDNEVKKEGENTRVFVNLDSDSDDGMKRSPELESDDSLIVINSECKTPSKKFKSSSNSMLCEDGVSNKNNHAQLGNGYTQSPGNTNIESARRRYMGMIPTSVQKHRALERAEQLQENIRNPSCVISMTLSHVSGSYWLTLTKKFCKDHLPDHDTEMILECKVGAKYKVKYISKRNAFSGGWVSFARVLRLQLGDVLVFELTGSTQFKVHIVKAIQEV